jgi:carbamoyltransferase
VKILGLASESHDAGLALIDDGLPLLVIEEERLNRQKHTARFPTLALEAAFGNGRLFEDIDVITTPWDMRRLRWTFLKAVFGHPPSSFNLLRPAADTTNNTSLVALNYFLRRGLRRQFPDKKQPAIIDVGHHDAHAAIYFASPFEEATVLVMDGYGDDAATSTFTGKDNALERRWHGRFFDSIGMIYTLITEHLGFYAFEEGTVMALAACGSDTYLHRMRDIVHLEDEGRFSINMTYFSHDRYGMLRPFTRKFLDTFGPARERGSPLADRHRDLARALQTVTEEVVVHVARWLAKAYPSKNLCFTGGVALNCVANGRILRDTDFERVWIPPCASDTGAPLGSALWHYHQTLGHPRRFEMTHAFYGMEYGPDDIKLAFDRMGILYERLTEVDLVSRVAQDLASDKVVGWFQGRFEMGPRALGNRSILASPLKPGIREIMNARIKFREPFRPFAPAVLAERAADYFETNQGDPYMTIAVPVRPEVAHKIPAAVHVDGTARIQTVERNANPLYYDVIEAFMKLTGVPIILNTSFNKQEPIIARPEEAISCFLRTEMDVLVIGDFYCVDRSPEAVRRASESFTLFEANQRGGE